MRRRFRSIGNSEKITDNPQLKTESSADQTGEMSGSLLSLSKKTKLTEDDFKVNGENPTLKVIQLFFNFYSINHFKIVVST